MSYGVAIICTKIAATGLGLKEKYHQLESEKECAKYLMELTNYEDDVRKKTIDDIRKRVFINTIYLLKDIHWIN